MVTMKLSSKESDILACMGTRADLSIAQVRKETGLREHTIRYALHSLQRRQLMSRAVYINLPALGYTMHNIFFSVSAEQKSVLDKLITELMRIPEVVWVAELGGDYQYAIDLAVKGTHEVPRILERLSKQFGNIFFDKAVSVQYGSWMYPRAYLSGKSFKAAPLRSYRPERLFEIDELDDKILRGISQFPQLSHRQLALKLSVPLSTLELRLAKLRAGGVLTGAFFALDCGAVGFQSFKLLVFGKGMNHRLGIEVQRFAATHPNVVSLFEYCGAWDFEITVEVPEARTVTHLVRELYQAAGSDINTIKVLTLFAHRKSTPYPV